MTKKINIGLFDFTVHVFLSISKKEFSKLLTSVTVSSKSLHTFVSPARKILSGAVA
jgi:hypothetical protein